MSEASDGHTTCTGGPAPRLCTRCGQAPEEPAVTRDASGGPMVVMACRRCDTESLAAQPLLTAMNDSERLDLDALEALRRGANDLPWWVVELNESDDGFDVGIMSEHVAITDGCIHGEIRPSDARYAVAAANAVPDLIARIRELEKMVADLKRTTPTWTPANGSSRQAAMLLAQDLNRSDAEGLARVLVQLRIGVDPTMPPRGDKARRLAVVECLIAAQNEERNRD